MSSHYNYSYGSAALHGAKDTSHWDVPPTFPADAVLALAKKYASGMERKSAAPRRKRTEKAAPAKAVKNPAKKATPAKVVKKTPPARVAKKAAPKRVVRRGET